MANLDDILKMFTDSSEKKVNVKNNYWELAKLGKAQFQAMVNGKSVMKSQTENKESVAQEKIDDDSKYSSEKIPMNRISQNNSNKEVKNSSNSKEVFSYDFTEEELVKGFIFSEVIGRPKSKMRDKSFRGRRAR